MDYAYLASVNYEAKSDPEQFVMATWHEDESLSETFWFAGHAAHHPSSPLADTYLIDVRANEREAEILGTYAEAQKEPA